MEFVLILLVLGALFFMLSLPARRQRREMAELARFHDSLVIGDEVIIAAGIHGTIADLTDDTVHLTIAPGTTIKVARQAVVGRAADERVESAEPTAGPGDGMDPHTTDRPAGTGTDE